MVAAHQELTAEWWSAHRNRFDVHISELALDEAGSGDAEAAARRLGTAGHSPAGVHEGSHRTGTSFPRKRDDSSEIGSGRVPCRRRRSSRNGLPVDLELPAHRRHTDETQIMGRPVGAAAELGYDLPVLCTPEQLMGDRNHARSDCRRNSKNSRRTRGAFQLDIDAIFEDLKRSERESGHPLVTLPPKRIAKPARQTWPGGRAA